VVKGAYLVQKLLADGEPPLFVIGIEVSMRLDSSAGQDLAQQIAERLSLPGESWVVCIGHNRDFRSRLKAVTGSFVYTRD
jgi:hypothetical protein